ncbi:hypothetical protein Msi02_30390 [Microbispora siamensis]|uniref:Uncharacterized protein n=1 Tax=Microbispora siamensis TaxID=564413 RepID=A0ABQ4GLA8_9ACTN|nr:hypothetical protein Msi02_30390 [Microbispora siamensis]
MAAAATPNSGYRRKKREIQKARKLARCSKDAGTMYPLTKKNTITPYQPGSKAVFTGSRASGNNGWRVCSKTTVRAAIPRSASSHVRRFLVGFSTCCDLAIRLMLAINGSTYKSAGGNAYSRCEKLQLLLAPCVVKYAAICDEMMVSR